MSDLLGFFLGVGIGIIGIALVILADIIEARTRLDDANDTLRGRAPCDDPPR